MSDALFPDRFSAAGEYSRHRQKALTVLARRYPRLQEDERLELLLPRPPRPRHPGPGQDAWPRGGRAAGLMGRVRERPRLVAAQVLAVVVVAGAGVLIGMALAGDETKVPAATQARLGRAERGARQIVGLLNAARADADRARAAAARAGRR